MSDDSRTINSCAMGYGCKQHIIELQREFAWVWGHLGNEGGWRDNSDGTSQFNYMFIDRGDEI